MYSQNCPEFQLFLENTPAAVAMFDREMRYIAATRKWLTDYGFKQQSLIGRYHYEVFPHPDKWKAVHQRCLAGSVESCEVDSIVRVDGSLEWVKWESRPWYDCKGEIGGIVFFSEVITERHLAEQERQKFVSLVENSSEFIGIASLYGQVLFVNEAGQKLVGLENSEQVRQKVIFDYHTPEDSAYFQEQILPLVIKQGCWQGEFRFRHFQTGALIPIHYNVFVIKDQKTTQPIALACITRDITEHKQAEEALRQSEARYRELAQREQLLNSLASQIRNSLDLNTVIETAIQKIQQLLHIDRCTFCWYKPDADPPTWEAIKEAKNPDLPILLGSYPATMVGAVTEQLLNQEILRIDNVATFAEPIFRQLCQSLGYQSEILLPIKTLSGDIGVIVCGHCSYPRPWTDTEVELLQAVVDQLAIAINQAKLYAQSHKAAVTAQNQAQQLKQTLEELKRTQAKLVQSEKMSSLGQLVAGVAHEINNPVNFIFGNLVHASRYTEDILGLLKLYEQTYSPPTPEIQEEINVIDLDFLIVDLPKLLSSMKVGADRIRGIVRSLRNFSRHDEAQKKAVDIHEGIDSTLMILQNRLKAKPDHPGIEVIKNYGPLPLVECYAGQLNQVFMNLLANAIDALEEQWSRDNSAIQNSKLALSSSLCLGTNLINESKVPNPQIHIYTEVVNNECVTIRISDNGLGMTPEVQQRLFEPFFTTKPVGVGTGLGLAISYQIIVEKHGGQLYCLSALGEGSKFVIEIPIGEHNY